MAVQQNSEPPRCPVCGDPEPVELPPRRVGFHRWVSQWHCMECGEDFDGDEYYTPADRRKGEE